MKKNEAHFLSRLLYAIVMAGIVGMAIVIAFLPWVTDFVFRGSAFYALVPHSKVLILLYITSLPAWLVLWMTRRLAKNIIIREPFSKSSARSLKVISICAIMIFICYLWTCLFLQATFGIIVITTGAFMVALIAAILYKLVELATEMKEENELTI